MSQLFPEPPSSELTDERHYARRREFLRNAGLFALTAAGVGGALLELSHAGKRPVSSKRAKEAAAPVTATSPAAPAAPVAKVRSPYDTDEPQTPYDTATHYNNYYEFGTDKVDPAENAHTLKTRPWTLVVDGLCKRPQTIDLDVLLKMFPLEERVYRMRCVEAWSMVLPWLGFPLGELIKRCEPLGSAKYLAFTTLYDEQQMPLTRSHVLDWPYREGLRLDEAMHPLTLFAVGLYGHELLGQNGAPLRLVVPWKYGFKGIKSIVRMSFVEQQPYTTWSDAASNEYGFYANVNPAVDHPRWSQARERRIGELIRRPTLPFNGYAEQVASLYSGMDLRKNF